MTIQISETNLGNMTQIIFKGVKNSNTSDSSLNTNQITAANFGSCKAKQTLALEMYLCLPIINFD